MTIDIFYIYYFYSIQFKPNQKNHVFTKRWFNKAGALYLLEIDLSSTNAQNESLLFKLFFGLWLNFEFYNRNITPEAQRPCAIKNIVKSSERGVGVSSSSI